MKTAEQYLDSIAPPDQIDDVNDDDLAVFQINVVSGVLALISADHGISGNFEGISDIHPAAIGF